MEIRFLTDYLNNDIYYKITYENQNWIRAQNQALILFFKKYLIYMFTMRKKILLLGFGELGKEVVISICKDLGSM